MPAIADVIPLRRTPTDIQVLLRTALAPLQGQAAAADVGLVVEVSEDVPANVSIDRAKIAWAVTALVGNALRYVKHGSKTMPGGSIVVRATRDAGAPDVEIDVQDDGPGIARDRVEALFGKGTEIPGPGLALLMVRDVVTAHGGTLSIDSHVSGWMHGTTVRITLPIG
jgi:signal transduction histidine kinase